MICAKCGRDDKCRLGYCWDCAAEGDLRLGRRSVLQHVIHSLKMARKGYWDNARIDLECAWERLTRTGDYAPGREWSHL